MSFYIGTENFSYYVKTLCCSSSTRLCDYWEGYRTYSNEFLHRNWKFTSDVKTPCCSSCTQSCVIIGRGAGPTAMSFYIGTGNFSSDVKTPCCSSCTQACVIIGRGCRTYSKQFLHRNWKFSSDVKPLAVAPAPLHKNILVFWTIDEEIGVIASRKRAPFHIDHIPATMDWRFEKI